MARCLTVSDSYGLRVSTSGYACHGARGCSDTSEGVGAVKLYVVVSEAAGGNVGGGVEGDGGGGVSNV